jgi:hypothetical protein
MTKMSDQFYIVTKAHEAIWPRGVLLFWGPDSNGYSTTLEHYVTDEAGAIREPLTVAGLIEVLSKMPQDAFVVIDGYELASIPARKL